MTNSARSGFSLVEVIVAMVILSVGVLAMGASTGYVMRQIRASELRTQRAAVMAQAAEMVRGTSWSELSATCDSQTLFTSGGYTLACTVDYPSTTLARIHITSVGPGYTGGRFQRSVSEGMGLSRAQPVN